MSQISFSQHSETKQNTVSIYPIPAFSDNYIWCIQDTESALVVDPGDAAPVKAYLNNNQLQLKGILITHHHADHIGGLRELVSQDIEVYGPVSHRIPHITHSLKDGEQIDIGCLNLRFEVLHVPGHTTEHIAYYGQGMLFCGDTMFSGGCGRLFEGTPAQMHGVFQQYRELPGETKVYCTHEYTLANLAFAEHLTPNNANLIAYKKWATAQRESNQPTLPSTVAQEMLINPYMLTSDAEMIAALTKKTGQRPASDVEAFAAIRHLKDNF